LRLFANVKFSASKILIQFCENYWSVRIAGALATDLAWTYETPLPAVAPIANMLAF
jgi:hypothetical protein